MSSSSVTRLDEFNKRLRAITISRSKYRFQIRAIASESPCRRDSTQSVTDPRSFRDITLSAFKRQPFRCNRPVYHETRLLPKKSLLSVGLFAHLLSSIPNRHSTCGYPLGGEFVSHEATKSPPCAESQTRARTFHLPPFGEKA